MLDTHLNILHTTCNKRRVEEEDQNNRIGEVE